MAKLNLILVTGNLITGRTTGIPPEKLRLAVSEQIVYDEKKIPTDVYQHIGTIEEREESDPYKIKVGNVLKDTAGNSVRIISVDRRGGPPIVGLVSLVDDYGFGERLQAYKSDGSSPQSNLILPEGEKRLVTKYWPD